MGIVKKYRWLTALAGLGVAALVAPIVHAQAGAAETVTVNAWVWNIAGGYHGSQSQQVDAVVESIQANDADFVVVNELCGWQYEAMKTRLKEVGWPLGTSYARFTKMDDRGSCDSDVNSAIGFGIFSKHQLAAGSTKIELTEDPYDSLSRSHYLTCVGVQPRPQVKLCATHITPTRDDDDGQPVDIGDRQIDDAMATIDSYVDDGYAVLFAGDLNTQPHEERLNGVYSAAVGGDLNTGNHGAFRELDDDDADHCLGHGEYTKDDGEGPCGPGGRKLDYIFADADHIAGGYDADSLAIPETCGGPCSDHHGVVGEVQLAL